MATARLTWFGVVVEFDHREITQITSTVSVGGAGAGALAAMLTAMGVTGPVAVVAGIVSALLTLGVAALIRCDSK